MYTRWSCENTWGGNNPQVSGAEHMYEEFGTTSISRTLACCARSRVGQMMEPKTKNLVSVQAFGGIPTCMQAIHNLACGQDTKVLIALGPRSVVYYVR